MKYFSQFAIILFVSVLGELCAMALPLPIPACIYGMVLMFMALCFKIIKLEQVDDAGKFMIEVLPVMFTPPAVGLIALWDVISPIWPQLLVIIVITTAVVMVVTGHVAQFMLRHEQKPDVHKLWQHIRHPNSFHGWSH